MNTNMLKERSRVLMVECTGEDLMGASVMVGPLGMVFGIYSDFASCIKARNQTNGILNIRVMVHDMKTPLPFEEGLIGCVVHKDGMSRALEEPTTIKEGVPA